MTGTRFCVRRLDLELPCRLLATVGGGAHKTYEAYNGKKLFSGELCSDDGEASLIRLKPAKRVGDMPLLGRWDSVTRVGGEVESKRSETGVH